MTYWIAIGLGGIATYLVRAVPLVVATRRRASPATRRYLDALPVAIIAALAGSGIAVPDGSVTGGAEVVAAVGTLLLAIWRKSLLVAMVGGVAIVAVLRASGF